MLLTFQVGLGPPTKAPHGTEASQLSTDDTLDSPSEPPAEFSLLSDQLKELSAIVAGLRADVDILLSMRSDHISSPEILIPPDPANELIDNAPKSPPAQPPRKHSLHDALNAELGTGQTSPWGRNAEETISAYYETHWLDSPFFRDYGGAVTVNCAKTLCEMAWSPDAPIPPNQLAILDESVKWELIPIVAQAGQVGEFYLQKQTQDGLPAYSIAFERAETTGTSAPANIARKAAFSKVPIK